MSPERRVGTSIIDLLLDTDHGMYSMRLLLKEAMHPLAISKKEARELVKLVIRVVLLVDVNVVIKSRVTSNGDSKIACTGLMVHL